MAKKIVYECDLHASPDCKGSIEVPADGQRDPDYVAIAEYGWIYLSQEWVCPMCVKVSNGSWREAIGCASGICGGLRPEDAIRNIRG